MKRFFAIFALLSLVALVGCDDVKVGLRSDMYVMYYTSTDGNIVVPKADAFDANIISNTYKDGQGKIAFDIDITTIGEAAFFECSTLRSITIPEGVTSIGGWAFYDCTSLTSVTIGNGVTSIGTSAFLGCTSLTSVTIGNGVTSIGYFAFQDCTSLTRVTIPDSVTSIGYYAFQDCTSLTSVYCKPTTPPSGGSCMFDYNASWRKIYVPAESVEAYRQAQYWIEYSADIKGYNFEKDSIEAVTTIIQYTTTDGQVLYPNDADAFGATIITNYYEDGKGVMIFDGDVTTIGYHAFYGCDSLASITIPNSVSSIANGAFAYCTSLTSISIPKGVTVMGDSAFYCCESLTSATIRYSVTSIGSSTFSGCSSLKSITIPESVTSIGQLAFADCTSLKSVYCYPTTPPTAIPDSSSRWDAFDSNASGRKIYVPKGRENRYKYASFWSDYAADIVGYEF